MKSLLNIFSRVFLVATFLLCGVLLTGCETIEERLENPKGKRVNSYDADHYPSSQIGSSPGY